MHGENCKQCRQKVGPKSVTEGNGIYKQLTDTKFFISFQVCRFLFGFTKALSIQLQGTNMEIIRAYDKINLVTEELKTVRNDAEKEFGELYRRSSEMALKVDEHRLHLNRF
ncbi:Uncharacterised protein r2_g3575 [Pycnogonum litorale]